MAHQQQITHSNPCVSEDDKPAELDEPPDDRIRFPRSSPFMRSSVSRHNTISSHAMHSRKASLLTRGLLTSPELTPSSDAEAPYLTSDGGLTSPARTVSPSPPLPAPNPHGLTILPHQDLVASKAEDHQQHAMSALKTDGTDNPPATSVELGLGRKRCIKFACGRQATAQPEEGHTTKATDVDKGPAKPEKPSQRPCMLKFVCSTKTSARQSEKQTSSMDGASKSLTTHPLSTVEGLPSPHLTHVPQHCVTGSATKDRPLSVGPKDSDAKLVARPVTFNRPDLEGSEATRFHEFAGPYNGEDEWVNEQTAYRKKITVNDTLQKENAIRKLGEEAEEEAMEEAEAEEEKTYGELDEANEPSTSDDSTSNGGNESDDEEGFADSDDESQMGSDYQFWAPGLTTTATSVDHLEHFRPFALRTSSNSSIESKIRVKNAEDGTRPAVRRSRKSPRTQPLRMRPGTPDLPDSTDFVCGTLDEDRPLEAAYLSCLEERRRSKHSLIPQDIDPSFPTSDPEEDEDDEGNTAKRASLATSDELLWVTGRPDNSDEEQIPHARKPLSRRNTKSPMPSPKRRRSPPPPAPKRTVFHRSPAPPLAPSASYEGSSSSSLSRFNDNAQPMAQEPSSPPPIPTMSQTVAVPRLARRPNLTHAASLPRTPNPFWAPCRQWSRMSSAANSAQSKTGEMHSRGPIDIVTGLEKKRQRRKEKFWKHHCRHGGKGKDRRCQPGKGAERMRELGLEIAGKNKGHLTHMQLMLSI
ncbi:MAG: hypothetical protein Q9170_000556 [Blastenia crenularia]